MNTLIQIARLFKAVETIEGRKRLQKMVHILQEFGIPFGLQFSYHYYGPYSEDLQTCIQSYKSEGLINEIAAASGPYPTSNFKAGDSLMDLLSQIGDTQTPEWSELANELKHKSAKQLEAISTLIHLGVLQQPSDSLKAQFLALKPQLESLYEEASRDLVSMRDRFGNLAAA